MINDVSKTINSISVRIATPARKIPTTTTSAATTTTTRGLHKVGDFPSYTDADISASATDVSKTINETTMAKASAALVRTTATTTIATTTITPEGAWLSSPVSKLTTIQKKITTNPMQNCLEPMAVRTKSTENKCPSKELTTVSIQRELEAISCTTRPRHNFNNNDNVGTSTQNPCIEPKRTSVRCKRLESNGNTLPEQKTRNISKTIPSLAERKAKLKSDFFKDTSVDILLTSAVPRRVPANRTELTQDQQLEISTVSRIGLPKRLLRRNTSNLRLKIIKHKEVYTQKSTIAVTDAPVLPTILDVQQTTKTTAPATVKLSLVEQRKLDLKHRFEEPLPVFHRNCSPSPAQVIRSFPRVEQLVQKFDSKFQRHSARKMIVNTDKLTAVQSKQSGQMLGQLKPDTLLEQRNSPLSDEGCNLGQSPYSSDNEDNESIRTTSTTIERCTKRKDKVARSASSDSALGLEVDDPMDVTAAAVPPTGPQQQQRRMTLTVTDLPLRPALLPLAEPTALPDSPTTALQQTLQDYLLAQSTVPSKVLLEERVIEIPEDPRSVGCSLSSSRRESAQSVISDYPPSECGGVRFVRTPSVVVSDYSDDVMCGITLEEIEYFRAQRMRRRRSSLDTSGGTEKDNDVHSDVSAASSCSNLYYCGSTISALDGAECFVNGMRLPLERKTSDCSTCSAVSGEDEEVSNFTIPEQPEDPCQMGKDLADLLAAQHLSSKNAKKVGLTSSLVPLVGGDSEKTDM